MKYLIFSLISLVASTAFGQRSLKGVYQGELISPINVLVINQHKDSIIQGSVYTNQFDHYPFFGIYNKNKIRGTITISQDTNETIILFGTLKKDTIIASLISSIDSTIMVNSKLHKRSSNINFNLDKSFGKISQQFDPKLFGKWTYVYTVNSYGELKSNLPPMTIEYFSNGSFAVQTPLSNQIKGTQNYIRMTWFTFQDKLVTKIQINFPQELKEKAAMNGMPLPPESSENWQTYKITGDTLVTISKNLSESYYRKSE
jgi:hypothetical protein